MFFSQDLNSDDADKVAILRVAGNLNLANAPLLENQIVDLISKEYGEQDEDQPSQIIIGTQKKKIPKKAKFSHSSDGISFQISVASLILTHRHVKKS